MPNLMFNSLKVLSNPTKSANQFDFHPKLNLITAADNSVGKSTLAKLLFWSIGCEPFVDTTWQSQDCQTILNFSIGEKSYSILRYKEILSFKDETNSKTEYHKITGEFSQKLAELFGFKALLPNRSNNAIETPPPAYYFLPYYVDQVKSWSVAWDNFDKLHQYEKWKSTIIKYHVGLLTSEHFELEKQKFEKKLILTELEVQIEKYNTALEVVKDYTPEVNTTMSQEKFDEMTGKIREDLRQLSEAQEKLLDELAKTQSEKSYLESQAVILRQAVETLDKDYIFAYENIEGDVLECPLCATQHINDIFSRSSILNDKAQAENQLSETMALLEKQCRKYESASKKLIETKANISSINNKYVIEDDNKNRIELSTVIENIAGKSITQNVINSKKEKVETSSGIAKEITGISKKQKGILSEEEKEEINKQFVLKFSAYTQLLNATAVNASAINSPLDYNKVVKEGGAAESTRAILAYYLTIFSMIKSSGSNVIAPFVIDTPNQQEQSLGNYDKIIELIFSELAPKTQVFICAMENSLLAPFGENGKVIILDNNRLLLKDKFEKIGKVFADF